MMVDDIPPIRMEDRVGFMYVEKASIYVKDNTMYIKKFGTKPVPFCVSNVSCLLLGAGTSVTRDAIKLISDHNTTVLWCGKRGMSMYSVSLNTNTNMQNAKTQIDRITNHRISLWKKLLFERNIVYKDTDNVKELLLLEATYMKRQYKELASKYGLTWNGRVPRMSDMKPDDTMNYAITVCNMALYGIATACICAMGFMPQFGVIHGYGATPLSYDLADVVKTYTSIPIAMEYVSTHDTVDPNELLCMFSNRLSELSIDSRFVRILNNLFLCKL